MEWVTIAVFNNTLEANIERNLLESFEIPCFLKDENMAGLYFNIVGGVALQVPSALEARAREILENSGLA